LNSRCSAISARIALIGLCSLPSLGRAQPMAASCAAQHITLTEPIESVWAERLERACALLAERHDLDAGARVEISAGPENGLSVRGTLRDGRSALRQVDSAEALALTLQALLVLPKPVDTPPPASAVSSAPDKPKPDQEVRLPAAAHAPFLQFGIGLGVIGHLFGAPTYAAAGFALRASVRVGPVLMDIVPRWEAEQGSQHAGLPDFEMHNFGVGLTLGARVWSDDQGAIETGAGVLVLEETQTYRAADGSEVGGSRVSGQLSAYGRLLWGGHALRWSIGLDAQLAPGRLADATHISDVLPALPVFGIGIAFGAHWES
jgi:hypothetical protein